MHRFFVAPEYIKENTAILTGGDAAHAGRVLRLQPGDAVLLCDGMGFEYDASVSCVEKDCVTLSVATKRAMQSEPITKVTLYQGLPKQGKMETILQKCVELGASGFVPVRFARCVVRLDEKEGANKAQRWQKVVEQACKQSGRGSIPAVQAPLSFEQSLALMRRHELLLVAYENETEKCLRDYLQKPAKKYRHRHRAGGRAGIRGG